jgi:hypothetical protein
MYTKKFTDAESSTSTSTGGFEWQKKLSRSVSGSRLCWLHYLIKQITQCFFLVAFFVAKWQEDLLSTSLHTLFLFIDWLLIWFLVWLTLLCILFFCFWWYLWSFVSLAKFNMEWEITSWREPSTDVKELQSTLVVRIMFAMAKIVLITNANAGNLQFRLHFIMQVCFMCNSSY